MTFTRRSFSLGVAAGLASLAVPAVALARSSGGPFPGRPIRLVVPFGAGSSTDVVARLLAPHMAQALGQPIVVDNRAGATGSIGSAEVAKAEPDGYTLVLGTVASHATLAPLMPNLPYDILSDFTPIGLATTPPALIVINPEVPATNLLEFVEWSKTQPAGVSYGSGGAGGSGHLATELFRIKTGARLVHVPYKSANQAVMDLMAGHTKLMVYYAPVVPLVRSGKLRALALLGEQRADFLPDLPTAHEQGIQGLVASGWMGMFGPANLPDAIRDQLSESFLAALNDATIRERLIEMGQLPNPQPPAAFATFVRDEINKWTEVVSTAGVSLT